MKFNFCPAFLSILAFSGGIAGNSAFAQQQSAAQSAEDPVRQVKVDVTRSAEGETSTDHGEIKVSGNPSVLGLLKELELLGDFGTLEEGEVVQITIERKKKETTAEQIVVEFDPQPAQKTEPAPITPAVVETPVVSPLPYEPLQAFPPFLGVYYEYDNIPLRECSRLGLHEGNGVLLSSIIPATAADVGGLLPGDIITSVNGEPVTPINFERIIDAYKQGDRAEMTFYRDGASRRSYVTFGNVIPENEKEMAALKAEKPEYAEAITRGNYTKTLKAFRRGEELPQFDVIKDPEQEAWVFTKPKSEPKENPLQKVFGKPTGPVYKLNPVPRKVTIVMRMEEPTPREMHMLGTPAQGSSSFNEMNVKSLNFYPDANSDVFNLNCILLDPGAVEVQVFNSLGKEIYFDKANHFGGQFESQIDLADNDTKTFFLTLRQNDRTFSKKIILQ